MWHGNQGKAMANPKQTPSVQQPATQAPTPVARVTGGKLALQWAPVPIVAARNVQARAATLGNLAAGKAALTVRLGAPCRVRVPYTLACWERVEAELAAHGGTCPTAALAAVSTGDFVGYALRRKWLAPV